MAKYVYPAVFTKEENNAYSVDFPDVENCYTCGNSLVNAMEMASDVLAMMLCFREKEKKPIPVATPIKEIQTNEHKKSRQECREKFRIIGICECFILAGVNTPFEIRILCVRGGTGILLIPL